MTAVATLESRIDDLYQRPLSEFVASRNALAASLEGAERKRVKALEKPSALAWALNQAYWYARPLYDRVLKSGAALRSAQVSSLQGRSADVRGLADRHRESVAQAVAESLKLAEAAGVNPPADALRSMFETVSTRESVPEPHGRFVKTLQPSGFEALAGIALPAPAHASTERAGKSARGHLALAPVSRDVRAKAKQRDAEERGAAEEREAATEREAAAEREAAEEKIARERARAERRHQAAVERAEKSVEQAHAAERDARAVLERATRAREAAEERLAELHAAGPDLPRV
jgi:hypothetical protein